MRKKDQPHDRFFKDFMQNIEAIKHLLNVYLDKDIQKEIDWETLTPYDSSLIGIRGKQLYADVVYKALTKDDKLEIFLVFNHERKADALLPIKVEEYALGTLRKSVRQKQTRRSLIVCFTLYNGLQCPYPYVHNILDYFENRELAKKVLLEGHKIIDLSTYSDEELIKHGELGVLELFMKHVDNPELPRWIEENPEIAKKLAESEHIERCLNYVAEAGYSRIEDLLESMENVSKKLKEGMLTTAQQIEKKVAKKSRQEGMQEGIQQGMQEGMQQGVQQGMQTKSLEIAKNMLLQLHLSIDLVKKATGLSQKELEQLQKE